jgi:hypothetical protein
MVSSRVYPGLERKPGGPDNWVEKVGGLPDFIERVAKHLHYEEGMTISRAIATAVSQCKKWCAKGNAKACNAIRQWEQKKARSRVDTTDIVGRKLTDCEFAILLAQRAPGASGSNRPFDESKYLRNPSSGQFANKFSPAQLLAARRVVEGGITNLQVGQTFELPGDVGWVMRTAGGYLIQGPAGLRVGVKTLAEAVAASANLLAGEVSKVGETKK